MTDSKLPVHIFTIILLISFSNCLEPETKIQLHRTFSEATNEASFGMREVGLMLTGVISGILLFLCVMYNFKWKRESGWNFTFVEHFTDKKITETQTDGVQTRKGPKRSHHASTHSHHYKRNQGFHTHHTYPHQ